MKIENCLALGFAIDTAAGFSTFTPNCTLPVEVTNFVGTPTARGTRDIFLDCLFILFLCTWSVQHLNIPGVQNTSVDNPVARWRSTVKLGLNKVKWMLITLLMPELIVGLAMQDWKTARFFVSEIMRKCQAVDSPEATRTRREIDRLTTTFIYFANMGGIAYRVKRVIERTLDVPEGTPGDIAVELSDLHDKLWGLRQISTERRLDQGDAPKSRDSQDDNNCSPQPAPCPASSHCYADSDTIAPASPISSVASSLRHSLGSQPEVSEDESQSRCDAELQDTSLSNLESDCHSGDNDMVQGEPIPSHNLVAESPTDNGPSNIYYFTTIQLYVAFKMRLLEKLPRVPDEDIHDKSKGDYVVKGTAVVKMIWLLFQIAHRIQHHMPVTQFEVGTGAFCVCMSIAYGFYWSKPQDITIPKVEHALEEITTGQLQYLNYFTGESFFVTNILPQEWRRNSDPLKSRTTREKWLRQPSCADPVPNDLHIGTTFSISDVMVRNTDIGVVLVGMTFGSINCLAWNYEFPNEFQKFAWQASSIVTATSPLAFAAANTFIANSRKSGSWWAILMLGLLGISYVLARFFLIVIMCTSLLWQPPQAFARVSWF